MKRKSSSRLFLTLIGQTLVGIIVGIIVAHISINLAIKRQSERVTKEQMKEATYMLENILSEIHYNIQKIDELLPILENVYHNSKVETPPPVLFLSTGAFRAAATTGLLRHIPKYAFALIAYYEIIDHINAELQVIREYTGLRASYKSLEIENLKRHANTIIKNLESLKETLGKMKRNINRDKLLIVQDKIRPRVKRVKDGVLIIHPEAPAVPDTSGVDVNSLSKHYFGEFLKLLYNLII